MIMRWLLGVLVVLNFAYFIYNGWVRPDAVSGVASEISSEHSVAVAPDIAENAETIRLLSEEIAAGQAKSIKSEEVVVAAEPEPLPVLCTQIGAFQAKDSAEQVIQRLMAAGIGADIRQVKVPAKPDFWVYIPPLPSRTAAIRKLKELQANKIDSFVVTEGVLANGISLGLFTRKKLATQLYEKYRAQDYGVEMKEVERFRFEYWVEIHREDMGLFGEDLWENIRQRYGFAEKHDNLCSPGVASPE